MHVHPPATSYDFRRLLLVFLISSAAFSSAVSTPGTTAEPWGAPLGPAPRFGKHGCILYPTPYIQGCPYIKQAAPRKTSQHPVEVTVGQSCPSIHRHACNIFVIPLPLLSFTKQTAPHSTLEINPPPIHAFLLGKRLPGTPKRCSLRKQTAVL